MQEGDCVCFFFFSSRRRHTRCSRDWSSDVCSSDLLWLRRAPRLAYVLLLVLMVFTLVRVVIMGHASLTRRTSWITVLTGLWFFSALFAYLSVKTVHGLERIWRWSHLAALNRMPSSSDTAQPGTPSESSERFPTLAVGTFSGPLPPPRGPLLSSRQCTVLLPNA